MELSPQAVAAATFKTVKRGYDPDEVRSYLVDVAGSLEASQQQATAMEARARAAIAKLQDASQHGAPTAAPTVTSDDTENISRTLLLAQRTADATVSDAHAEAASIRSKAEVEAAGITAAARTEAAVSLEQAQTAAARLLDEAKEEVRRAKSEEHVRAEAEYSALLVRREALLGDVDALERHVTAERGRIREVSVTLGQLADRVPGGLGAAARPPVAGSGLVTGQVPLTPGLEPLVSPRPTSDAEVRSMWQQAEQADLAAADGPLDGAPVGGTLVDGVPVDDAFDADSATPPSGTALDDELA